jgi:multiple sugar transport system ATP-binding protein
MADVQLTQIRKAYGPITILHGVDLEIREGEFMVFVGPSGCGKSTLLRVIAGLEDITGGELRIGGRLVNEVPPAERGIAMVFQSYALYPHMDLFENMAFGLRLTKTPEAEIKTLVHQAAKVLNIEHLLQRKPKDLSGGQRQRVAIGRAIVRKPQVFLFDEPLSNLDAALRVRMRYEFAKLHADMKTTMVYVTHDQVEAMTLADRIVVLNAGRIEQVGAPLELYDHPCNLFVAGFIGSPKMNFLAAEVVAATATEVQLKLADGTLVLAQVEGAGLKAGEQVTYGIRPEHLRMATPGQGGIKAELTFVESLGSSTQGYCSFPGVEESLTCTMDDESGSSSQGQVLLHVPPAAGYVFNAAGQACRRLNPSKRERPHTALAA